MRKSTRIIAWTLYGISVLIILLGVILFDYKYIAISLASLFLTVPWIICIVSSIKSKENANGLWIILIILFGMIAIPIWLVRHGNKKESNTLDKTAVV